jgi:hypothetical protein
MPDAHRDGGGVDARSDARIDGSTFDALNRDVQPIDVVHDAVVPDTGLRPDTGPVDVPTVVCGTSALAVRSTPPNILVLFDRSCSMAADVTGVIIPPTGTTSKWAIALRAVNSLTMTYATQVRWGLLYFPNVGGRDLGISCTSNPVCGAGTPCPEVVPQTGGATMVRSVLNSTAVSPYTTCTSMRTQAPITPIAGALDVANGISALRDATRNNIVLLMTDGGENCLTGTSATIGPQLASRVMTLRTAGIKTAVVGFGMAGPGGVDSVELNAMADVGGLPASGTNHYYAANDEATLSAALGSIVASTISCTFALSSRPMYPDQLQVYVNASTMQLARNRMNGWDYDATTNSITVYGTTCSDVQHSRVTQLNVVENCPGAPPPPPPPMCHNTGGTCVHDSDCCGLGTLVCFPDSHTCGPVPG